MEQYKRDQMLVQPFLCELGLSASGAGRAATPARRSDGELLHEASASYCRGLRSHSAPPEKCGGTLLRPACIMPG